MKLAIGLAILGGAIVILCARSNAQISTEEAQRRLAERQAERAAHPPATRPAPIAATQHMVATRPAVALPAVAHSVDGLPFPPVTCDRAKAVGPASHGKLSDIAELLLVPPALSGVKLYGVDASADLLRRRHGELSFPQKCQWFAIDLGKADLAGIAVDQGVITGIVLMYRDQHTAQQTVFLSYGQRPTSSSSHVGPWSVSLILPGQHFPGRWPAYVAVDVSAQIDPKQAAIANHELSIGMTLDEAKEVLRDRWTGRPYVAAKDGDEITWRWPHEGGSFIDATFVDGKLVRFRRY
ncbi:MAG TPA: hypothetical protein VK797_28765 [Tepidisphaeraceae bacterium]|jgi:hypothetical protein|nr:hypothetical protein [Tepidisphaeraceae bacterium]